MNEGSDIEVELDPESPQVGDKPDRLNIEQGGGGEFSEEADEDVSEPRAASEWKYTGFTQRSEETFKRTPGVKTSLPPNSTPLDAFAKLFDDATWN